MRYFSNPMRSLYQTFVDRGLRNPIHNASVLNETSNPLFYIDPTFTSSCLGNSSST